MQPICIGAATTKEGPTVPFPTFCQRPHDRELFEEAPRSGHPSPPMTPLCTLTSSPVFASSHPSVCPKPQTTLQGSSNRKTELTLNGETRPKPGVKPKDWRGNGHDSSTSYPWNSSTEDAIFSLPKRNPYEKSRWKSHPEVRSRLFTHGLFRFGEEDKVFSDLGVLLEFVNGCQLAW